MKAKIKKISLVLMAIMMVAVTCITNVNAADPTTGSLTIICHEQRNEDTTTNPPLKGIEYTLYKVEDDCIYEEDAKYYIEDNLVTGIAKTTDVNGKIIYDNLALGRYYAEVTYVPDGAYDYENFLVDIPMTNVQGNGYDYDITVEPKIATAFGNFELIKVDSAGKPIKDVTFKVQVLREYAGVQSIGDSPEGQWSDYIPEGKSEVLTVTTDESGKIMLKNLPLLYRSDYWSDDNYLDRLTYRLVEISAPEGYIINNKILSKLVFYLDYDGKIVVDKSQMSDFEEEYFYITEGENLTTVEYDNDISNIVKKVKNNSGNFLDSAGLNMKDVVTFKVTVDVPWGISDMSTFKITDTLPEGLILDRSSIVVEGATRTGSEVVPADMYTLSSTGLELLFDTSKMYEEDSPSGYRDPLYNSIIVTYNTTFDSAKAVIGGAGNINTATLEYTNNIDVDGTELSTTTISDTAEAHTGALKLEKVEKGNLTNKLSGAKFKIATSEANAKAGVFVKDASNNDIEVTTGANGQAEFKGLAYADNGADTSYWLVETQAPKYTEVVDGANVDKTYNLLKNPVEVKVGKTTYNTAVQVQNSKGLDLPATGGIGLAIFAIVGIGLMSYSVIANKKQGKAQE